ncbi:MAG TPA: sulfotransferase [Rhodanobacteraceae bacterium]|nr:sulfotransferase [Rhodanobacteraceae bacterium]
MTRAVQRHWERACEYLRQRRIDAARVEGEALRALAPGDVRVRILAAQIAWNEDRVRDAAACALDAVAVAPDDPDLLGDLVETLLQTGESAAARRLLDRPAWGSEAAADARVRQALLLQAVGETRPALERFDALVALDGDNVTLRFARAQAQAELGFGTAAEDEYLACLVLAPGFGQAAYRLVQLRTQTARHRRLRLIAAGLARAELPPPARAAFEFAAYHVHEDRGDHPAAWAALARGSALMHAWCGPEAARQRAGLQRLIGRLAELPSRGGSAHDGPCPIFIVGLPHSGAALLAYLLGGHPDVAIAGELVDFGQQLLRVADTRSVHAETLLARLPGLDLAEVGRRYLAQAGWRARGRTHFVDTQPFNWMSIGLIHAALPRARVLHVLRSPMDAAFANHRAIASGADAWAHDFATLAAHQRACTGLLRHWHDTLPGTVMDVRYEDLLASPKATLARVQAFCGLDQPRGEVASADGCAGAPVRVPPRIELPGLWRHYAAELEPLRRALLAPAT